MIGELHHYGVTVSEMEEALGFYRDALGLAVSERLSFASGEFSTFVGVEGVDVDIAFLDAGSGAIELLEYAAPPGDDANEGVANNDVGAAHICLEVPDIEAVHDELNEDVEFLSPPQRLSNGARVAYVFDPDGNVVELLQE